MYPNPVQNILNVEFTSPENNLQARALLEVFSADGKLLKTEEQAAKAFSANTIYADLSGYKNGVYFVKLSIGEYSSTRKILKQ